METATVAKREAPRTVKDEIEKNMMRGDCVRLDGSVLGLGNDATWRQEVVMTSGNTGVVVP